MTNSVGSNTPPLSPFSSSEINVLEIIREDTKPGTTPTEQVFKAEVREPDGQLYERTVLLRLRDNTRRMQILEDMNEEFPASQHEGIDRELTPGLIAEFAEVSQERLPFSRERMEAWQQFQDQLKDLRSAPGIRKIPATEVKDLILKEDTEEVDAGTVKAILISHDSRKVLRIDYLVGHIACGATARNNDSEMIIGLGEYCGYEGPNYDRQTPGQHLQKLKDEMLKQGALPETIKIYISGGMMTPHDQDYLCNLEDQKAFFELREQFPIVAAKMHETVIDYNSHGRPIDWHTDDDHNSQLFVVQTADEMLISHVSFFEEDSDS